ncbi:MAG: bifunctional molybdenum cofactor guanylyltransferase MobA/molybdopterin-guanine dinucleotide biosynthesis adaptor protein MobB [Chlorobium sp.]
MSGMWFHPFEIAFCGYSGSGKTTLVAALVRHLSLKFSIACYKHGCHRFDIDREGKDSRILKEAGAATVMISDTEKKALITSHGLVSSQLERLAFSDFDLLFVEGLKEIPLPKLLLVDHPDRRIIELVRNGTVTNVAALVVPDDLDLYREFGVPVFHRDRVAEIAAYIETFQLERSSKNTPMHALVLAGGHSSRMGSDKALIEYHTKNQLLHTAELLGQKCSKVFVSCREEQAAEYRQFGIPLITDSYLGIGPLGGLLSAQRLYPDAAWVVAACDLPFLDEGTLRQLCQQRNPFRFATAFRHPQSGVMEPLLACYEPKSRSRLIQRHLAGNNSLSAFLEESRVKELTPPDGVALRNINNVEERLSAKL